MPEEILAFEADIEQAIIDRLKTALSPLPVENLPEKPWNFTHPRGSALVMFTGMDPVGNVLDTLTSAQKVKLSYEVLLVSRSLRDHSGLYPMWAATRTALLGWKPAGYQPLKFERLRPQPYDEGSWALSCGFSTEAILVPDTEPDTGPLLQKVSIEFCEKLESPDP